MKPKLRKIRFSDFLRPLSGTIFAAVLTFDASPLLARGNIDDSGAIASALVALGDLHRKGRITREDGNSAFDFYLDLLEESGQVFAVVQPDGLVGILTTSGMPDAEAALRAYTKSGSLGGADGYLALAKLYLRGRLVPYDAEKAFALAQKAEELGSYKAGFLIGLMELNGTGTQQNFKDGLVRMTSFAATGDTTAMVELAQFAREFSLKAISPNPTQAFSVMLGSRNGRNTSTNLSTTWSRIYDESSPFDSSQVRAISGEMAIASMEALRFIGHVSRIATLSWLPADASYALIFCGDEKADDSILVRLKAGQQGRHTGCTVFEADNLLEATLVEDYERVLRSISDRYLADTKVALTAHADAAHRSLLFAIDKASISTVFELAAAWLKGPVSEPDADAAYDIAELPGPGTPLPGHTLSTDEDLRAATSEALAEEPSQRDNASAQPQPGKTFNPANASDLQKRDPSSQALAGQAAPAASDSVAEDVGPAESRELIEPPEPAATTQKNKAGVDEKKLAQAGHTGLQLPVPKTQESPGVSRSLAELKVLGAEGHNRAWLEIGDAYSRGGAGFVDVSAALDAYQTAAAAGNAEALMRLAEIYNTGLFGVTDRERAFEFLQQAADLGFDRAIYRLGQGVVVGEFGNAAQVDDGIALLKQAARRGNAEASVALAVLGADGSSLNALTDAGLARLSSAAASGNAAAGLRLLAAHRDGYSDGQDQIAPDREKAKLVLADITDLLTPEQVKVQSLLIDISTALPRDFAALNSKLKDIPPSHRPDAISQVLRINPNAYVYMLQSKMAEQGHYAGELTGVMSSETNAAVRTYCESLRIGNLCRLGPFSPSVTGLLAHFI